MNHYLKTLSFLAVIVLSSCKEEPIGQQPTDSVAPGAVTDVTFRNIPGGAVFRFTPPADEDLLYVKAVYSLHDGTETETKASVYADSLRVVGFWNTDEHTVKLIAVDRSRNESAPETVVIKPLTPDVLSVAGTIYLTPDFGGVHAYWQNPNNEEISVNVLIKDHNEEYVPLETFYSTATTGEGAVRGMDTIPADFAVYTQDRWGNRSENKFYTFTPMYETIFDRLKYQKVRLPTDAPEYPGYGIERIWDRNMTGDPCYSAIGGQGIWPLWITMDMGISGKISRIRLFQRCDNRPYLFAEGNLHEFEVWGCDTLSNETIATGSWDGWTKLMHCLSVKPSGLPLGQNTDEDIARATQGEDFINSPENRKVRYLRIKALRAWLEGDNFQIAEIEIYGDNR